MDTDLVRLSWGLKDRIHKAPGPAAATNRDPTHTDFLPFVFGSWFAFCIFAPRGNIGQRSGQPFPFIVNHNWGKIIYETPLLQDVHLNLTDTGRKGKSPRGWLCLSHLLFRTSPHSTVHIPLVGALRVERRVMWFLDLGPECVIWGNFAGLDTFFFF